MNTVGGRFWACPDHHGKESVQLVVGDRGKWNVAMQTKPERAIQGTSDSRKAAPWASSDLDSTYAALGRSARSSAGDTNTVEETSLSTGPFQPQDFDNSSPFLEMSFFPMASRSLDPAGYCPGQPRS